YASKLDDEARKLIQSVLTNARRMGQLIDDLLEFSRLGRKELVKTTVPMKDIVRSVWEDFVKMEGKRNIEFILKELPDAKADNATIKHVWSNLISNALKYSGTR